MTKFPQGVRVFPPKDGAPLFVKGQLIINPKELFEWLKANPDMMTDYKDQKQLKLAITERKDGKGWNTIVDTYKPKNDTDGFGNLPF